jgi:hypothetical protein
MITTLSNIADIKAAGQDFEWYPTTDEIIRRLLACMPEYSNRRGYGKYGSFLDIGAGNGKVLRAVKAKFDTLDTYAIEKSAILRQQIPDFSYIIGTDFYEQSLLDKAIDITFCNPPYSNFETWAVKIIRESASELVFLVLPVRWEENTAIADALKYRGAEAKSIDRFNFSNAERRARCEVNLIKIKLSGDTEDAFNREFSGIFPELKEKTVGSDTASMPDHEGDPYFAHLVPGNGYVKALVEMYRADIARIKKNYEAVGKLDLDVLREIGTDAGKVCEMLRQRLKGLKSLYWREMISHMKEVTDRLTAKRRAGLLTELNKCGAVDFTEGNAYAVILWVLRRANSVIDDQLTETYDTMIEKANVRNYKSNQKVYEWDRWRYNKEIPTHICLDYRIVLERVGGIRYEYGHSRLSENACNFISDLLTIANNIGFECETQQGDRLNHYRSEAYWKPGKPRVFGCEYRGKCDVVFEVKAFLNGNLHVRLNQKFALALNVEYGRLKGWIHSKGQAAEEIQDTAAAEFFKTNLNLLPTNILMLADVSAG